VCSSDLYAQNQKVRFANIAVGGRGGGHIGAAAGQNLVAICDTRQSEVDKVGKDHPDAKKYSDWRKLFDEMGKEIDAVFCATPDHTHFPVAYTAVMMGKHCYCETPLTHSIWEARTLAEATKKKKVATQMGNQGHAGGGIRRVVEWVQAGVLGEIKEIHTWTNRPVWPQGLDRPTDTPPCPPDLNWECFIGWRRCGRITRVTSRSTGADGTISGAGPSATWAATRGTACGGRWSARRRSRPSRSRWSAASPRPSRSRWPCGGTSVLIKRPYRKEFWDVTKV
jgi:hypothetical protein